MDYSAAISRSFPSEAALQHIDRMREEEPHDACRLQEAMVYIDQ